jgi:hypothetical protein
MDVAQAEVESMAFRDWKIRESLSLQVTVVSTRCFADASAEHTLAISDSMVDR